MVVEMTLVQPEKFHHSKGIEYYARQLTAEELKEIDGLNWTGWRKAIANYVIQCGNENVETQVLRRLLNEGEHALFDAVNAWELSMYLTRKKLPYRFTYGPEGTAKTGPFRFYRKVD